MAKPFFIDQDFFAQQSLGGRKEQQDCYSFSILEGNATTGVSLLLLTLADGMGGHFGGRVAGQTALKAFVDTYFSQVDGMGNPARSDNPAEQLKKALTGANAALDALIISDLASLSEAGTTLLSLVLDRQSVYWISVGDSPFFVWRKGQLTRLNADHSMRAVLARKAAAGQMRAADIDTHPHRNGLLSALNGLEPEMVDNPSTPFVLASGDILLAASDGLLTLKEEEISTLLASNCSATAEHIVQTLLTIIKKRGLVSQDNATIAVIKL